MIKNLAINKNIVFLLVVICLIYFSENIETFVLYFKSHLKSLKKEDNIDFKGECALFFLQYHYGILLSGWLWLFYFIKKLVQAALGLAKKITN